jgi:extracellular solute-binding protein
VHVILLAWMAWAGSAEPVQVRATRETAPCVRAALAASPRWREAARLEEAAPRDPGPADVLVASEIELTRALESGSAVANSDADLARIPWVFHGPGTRGLNVAAVASDPPVRVTLPAGPAAYEARRALSASRLVEVSDTRALRAATLALVPLSLAGEGPTVPAATVPPLIARTALATGARQPEAGRALVDYLASEAGQRAFAACGRP